MMAWVGVMLFFAKAIDQLEAQFPFGSKRQRSFVFAFRSTKIATVTSASTKPNMSKISVELRFPEHVAKNHRMQPTIKKSKH